MSNSFVIWGIVVELSILALIAYTPVGNVIFATRPVPLWIFGPLALGALMLLLAEEGRKIIANRLHHRANNGISQVTCSS